MNLATGANKQAGHRMTESVVGAMTALADLIEPAAEASLKINNDLGVPALKPVEYPILFKPVASSVLSGMKMAMLFSPLTAMRAWHEAVSDAVVEAAPPAFKAVMSDTYRSVRDLYLPDTSPAIEAIEDLEGIIAKTPAVINVKGPVYGELEAQSEEGRTRQEKDNPRSIDVLVSPNPGRNMRAASEILRVWGGDHSHHEEFTLKSVEFLGEEVPIQQVAVAETDLTEFILFHHGDPAEIEDLDLKGLTVLGSPHSGHPPAFVQPMAKHLLQTGRSVLIPAFKNPEHWADPDTFRDLDAHVAEFELAFKLAAELSGGRNFHAAAVCEPGSSMLAAASINRQLYEDNRYVPLSLTLINSPIFPGAADTAISEMAAAKSEQWLKNLRTEGNGRGLYEHQISAFIMKSLGRHMKGIADIGNEIVMGHDEKAREKATQYEALLHGMPLPWRFYKETFVRQFQNGELGKGEMKVRDIQVDPTQLDDMYLHTMGAADDDVTHEWQCGWAQVLCPGVVSQGLGAHSLVPGGHYAAWGDSRIAKNTAIPLVAEVMQRAEEAGGLERDLFIVNGQECERIDIEPYTPAVILEAKDKLRAEIPQEHLNLVPEVA